MKKLFFLFACSVLCLGAQAASYSTTTFVFRPDDKDGDPDDMFDLDHHYAYTWGITNTISSTGQTTYSNLKNQLTLGSGWYIESATITFKDIWDWVVEPNDRLWVNLLDTDYTTSHSGKDLKKGVTSIMDNADDIESTSPGSNYFNNQGTALSSWTASNGTSGTGGYWTDPNGGNEAKKTNVTFTFNASQLSALASYISNGGATSSSTGYADFGFGFDPDCHYYNTGIEFKVVTKRYYVPETASTLSLAAFGVLGAVGLRRKLQR